MPNGLPQEHETHSSLSETLRILENAEQFRTIAELFRRLSDATRLRIFWYLCHYEECVVNIAAALKMSSPAVSHHLKLLKEDGLIKSRRKGKEVYYYISEQEESSLLHQMIEQIMMVSCPELKVLPEHLDHSKLPPIHNQETDRCTDAQVSESGCHPVHKPAAELSANSYPEQQIHIIHQIHEYLTLHMDQHCTVESLARQFLINPTTLKILFKKEYGNSVAAHIREHRMEKAAELLRNSPMTMGEIAGKIGYANQSKFTSAFQAYFHMLPKEYRRMHRTV